MNDCAEDSRLELLETLGIPIPDLPGGAVPKVEDLLGELAARDPRMAAVARYVELRRTEAEEAAAMEAEDEEAEDEESQDERGDFSSLSASSSLALARVVRALRALQDRLTQERARTHALAAALGACYRCLGEDDACRVCDGAGGPGWFRPDPRLFDRFVAPACGAAAGESASGSADRADGDAADHLPNRKEMQ